MNKTNLMVDTGILIAFLIAMAPNLSGIAIHEWLSLALAGTVLVHLLLHWNWITSVGAKFFKNLWHTSRLKFGVDILVFVAFITVMLSGLLISKSALPAVGIEMEQTSMIWRRLHSTSADASLLLIALHFALNWGWMVAMVKRYVVDPLVRLVRPNRAASPVAVSNQDTN